MLFTVHGGFGTFRSCGAKVVWLEGCVYKHSAPSEPGSFIDCGSARRASMAKGSE